MFYRPKSERNRGGFFSPWIVVLIGCVAAAFSPSSTQAVGPFNFRVILVKTEKEAREILHRIRAGSPFWKLARDHSLYPNADLGGYVEEARSHELREEFRKVLEDLAPGEVSPIVPVGDRFAILRREAGESADGAWNKADKAHRQALRLAAQGDFSAARGMAERAQRLYPNHRGAHLVLRMTDGVALGRLNREIALRIFDAVLLIQEGFPKKALKSLESLDRSGAAAPEFQMALGEAYMVLGWTTKAIVAYEKVLAASEEMNLAHLYLGAAYLQGGDLSKALSHYQTLIAADTGLAPAHLGLGLVYLAMRDPERALREFRVALAIDPHLDPAYNQIGLVLLSQGKIEEAIGAFNRALHVRPNRADYLNHLGYAYSRWGLFSKAVEILEEAIALAPEDPLINNNLAVAYFENGQTDRAIVHADRAEALGYKVHSDFLDKLAPYRRRGSKAHQ